MKPSMAIKPLVFAIAAVMAVAVQAGQNDRRGNDHHHNNGHHNGHHTPPPTKVPVYATANAWDKQSSTGNRIYNEATQNSAEMSESAEGASGNVGVNVAAGNGNQQDNAAAIANAGADPSRDNAFVFGEANATAHVKQYSNNNKVINQSTVNSAVMSASANGGSGNMGINIAAGDLNQQKNTMAIANSNAPLGNATANAGANQNGPGLIVTNGADRTTRLDTITLTKTVSGSSAYAKATAFHTDQSQSSQWKKAGYSSYDASGKTSFDASGSNSYKNRGSSSFDLDAKLKASLDVDTEHRWSNGYHRGSSSDSFDADVKASLDVSVDKSYENKHESSFKKEYDSSFKKSYDSKYAKSGSQSSESEYNKNTGYAEASAFELTNSVTFQVLTPTGWANPVTNTATLSGSVNGGSGNLGVNVAAGVGNQQSNSLSIANQQM